MSVVRLPAAVTLRRSLIALCGVLFAIGLAACGHQSPHQNFANADNDGDYISAGYITYQLQISRELNQYGSEDSSYVKGLPPGVSPNLGPDQLWYGVFLWAKNQSGHPATTSDNFVLTDTQGNVYRPIKLDSAVNPFAWTSTTLENLETYPGPNTVASDGPTQGGLLLFKLSTAVYSNRPLTLVILGHGDQRLGGISLNL
ncbi:MAG TPA: hypothetical protein VIY10_02815 [Solirubrobacteraceae bacterium]|jgi:hypothetical protein